MHLNFLQRPALAGLVHNLIHFKGIRAKWLVGLICLFSIGYIIWQMHSGFAIPTVKIARPDSNGETGGANSYYTGTSNATFSKAFDLNGVTNEKEWASEFPYGYIILGLQQGKVIHALHSQTIQVAADWDNAVLSFSTEGNWGYVFIPQFTIINHQNKSIVDHVDTGEYFPLDYPEFFQWSFATNSGIPCGFIKVLDQQNKTLLVGLKPSR